MIRSSDEEMAFVRAIRKDWHDDTPRLAYCDWLQERAGKETCPVCHGASVISRELDPRLGLDFGHPREFEDPVRDGLYSPPTDGEYLCFYCSGTGQVPDDNAAREEFIRLQCELSQSSPESIPCSYRSAGDVLPKLRIVGREGGIWNGHEPDRWSPQEPGTRLRCAQMVLTHCSRWGHEFADSMGERCRGGCSWCGMDNLIHFEWERGFISTVSMPYRLFAGRRSGMAACRLVAIRSIRLDGCPEEILGGEEGSYRGHIGELADTPIEVFLR